MQDCDIARIESIIGYKFANKELLKRAFTHNSFCNGSSRNSYEKLEFLGDSIIGFIVAEKLCKSYPFFNEGKLTKARAGLVSRAPLSAIIKDKGLIEYMTIGHGSESIINTDKIYCDLYEAIVAAIYLDSDIEKARNFIMSTLEPYFEQNNIEQILHDYKTKLQEYAQKYKIAMKYNEVSASGPSHKPIFVYNVELDGVVMGEGKGNSKKEAQQNACKIALTKLKKKS